MKSDLIKLKEMINKLNADRLSSNDFDGSVEETSNMNELSKQVLLNQLKDLVGDYGAANNYLLDQEQQQQQDADEPTYALDEPEYDQMDKRSAFLRFGKRNAYLRFGRSQPFIRFGKRSAYLRFGKRNPAYLRFGRK